MTWQTICELSDILPFGGRCALIEGKQVAIFRVPQESGDQLFAISNYDPFSQANVLSRGLVGSLDDKTVVASPIYKQHFDLTTGQCIEDDSVCIETWDVQLDGQSIQIALKEAAAA